MIVEESFWIESTDQTKVHVKKWTNKDGTPKAIVQLSHGMLEHIDRYEDFAHFFVSNHIFVYGNDHRGHGQTGLKQGLLGYFADEDGFTKTMEDLYTITLKIKEEYPNIPIILFGHSMGSFLARLYVQKYSNAIAGLILSGTGYFPPSITQFGKQLAATLPPKSESKLLNSLAFGNYNKKIQIAKTAFDWLSRDEEVVTQYINDPLCGFVPTAKFFYDLLDGIESMQNQKQHFFIRKDLPILFISGDKDPVGNHTKGVWKSVAFFVNAQIQNITMTFFDGARHEIINEINKKEVNQFIYKWMKSILI